MLLGQVVGAACRFDPFGRPRGCPLHPTPPDHVVRPAGEAPIPYGGVQRHTVAVEGHRPVGGTYGCDDFLAAAAAAPVGGGEVLERDVQHASFDDRGHELDEF